MTQKKKILEVATNHHSHMVRGSTTKGPLVSVVIPIYNAYEEVCNCLASVFATISPSMEVILIDDRSTDSRIWPLLKSCKASIPRIKVKRNRKNLGYTKTINWGCNLAENNDVVLLNSDTMVTKGWLEHLSLIAYKHDQVATVTPLSNAAGAFSIPVNHAVNKIPSNWTIEQVSRLIRNTSKNINPEVPTGNGFCLYLRRSALDQVGEFDEKSFPRGYGEENDFCMRAIKLGLVNLIDDAVYVYHKRSASFGSEKEKLIANSQKKLSELHPEYSEAVRSWLSHDPLDEFRGEIGALLATDDSSIKSEVGRDVSLVKVPLTNNNKGCILYWLHDGQGGTRMTTGDLTESMSAKIPVFVVLAAKGLWTLYRVSGKAWRINSTYQFDRGWMFSQSPDRQRMDALQTILDRTQPELVHIRHLIGSAPEIMDSIHARNIPIVLSFHDFYGVCPTIQLIDSQTKYCGGTCSNSQVNNECPLAGNWFVDSPSLKNTYINLWKSRMSRSFEQCDYFVTTSQVAQSVMLDNFSLLHDRSWSIIEHGRDMQMYSVVRAKALTTPVKIAVFGALGRSKGIEFILELMKHDQGNKSNKRLFEFHFFGNISNIVDPEKYGGVIHGRYERDELSQVMLDVQPHCAMIASVWPETYCHTLTESWAMGLPVIATDIGAVAERIKASGGGWCFPFSDSHQFYQEMVSLFETEDEYQQKVEEVGKINIKSVAEMADDYQRLYQQVSHSTTG